MIYRIDVFPAATATTVDHSGESIRHQIAEFGVQVGKVSTRRVFLIETEETLAQVQRIAAQLLADPVVESAQVITAPPADSNVSRIEVHLKPGVMDPVAASTEMAIRDMGLKVSQVRTGRVFLFEGKLDRDTLERLANRILANGVVESVHFDAYLPKDFVQGRAPPVARTHRPRRHRHSDPRKTKARPKNQLQNQEAM